MGRRSYLKRAEARLASERVRKVLVGSAVVTLLLYWIPFGRFVAYPLLLLSTLVHELGHGVTAELVGGNFERFQMFADGSGAAIHTGTPEGVRQALVAAGGLVGPALLAGLGFLFVRSSKASRVFLGALALAFVAAELLVVRNAFGAVFVGLVILGLGWFAAKRNPEAPQVALAFVSVQLAASVFSRGDYLFKEYADTSLGRLPSDVTHIALALGGPYWMWGLIVGAVSVAIVALGLWWALRAPRVRR